MTLRIVRNSTFRAVRNSTFRAVRNSTFRSTRIVLGVAVPACLVALVALSFVVSHNRMADEIAWRWSSGGATDSMSKTVLFGLGGGLVVLLSTMLCLGVFSNRLSDLRIFQWLVFAVVLVATYVSFRVWETTSANLDINDWRQSAQPHQINAGVSGFAVFAAAIYCGWMAARLAKGDDSTIA